MRRVGIPEVIRSISESNAKLYFPPEALIPEIFSPRGRWKEGAMHTFCDDYRQEFFWRRPEEGLLVALSAGVVTAPDYTVYLDDPAEWRTYQAWRSAMVAAYWQSQGVQVIPVVSFGTGIARYVLPGSVWAIRGPARPNNGFDDCLSDFIRQAKPSCLIVFGKPIIECGVPVIERRLVSSMSSAARKEGSHGRS